MNTRTVSLILFIVTAVAPQAVFSQWQAVGTGIEYQHFTLPDPNHVFVARMDRSNLSATLTSTVANGTVKGARETVRNQAARYDDAINWWGQSWGQRNDAVVAINGDFFNGTTGVITGGQVQDGWYVKRFGDFGGYSGFGWTVNRVPFFGGCINHRAADQYVTYAASGQTQRFQGINVARSTDQLILYTPQYYSNTATDNNGSEVLIEMTQPDIIIDPPNYSSGYVRQIRQNQGSTYIPFDHIVLSATGTAATTLLNNVSVGGEVRITQRIMDYNEPDTSGENGCAYATGLDWQRTYTSVGVNYRFLENGQVRPPDPAHSGYAGLIIDNPRTAVAYNASYIFFVVVDGRSVNSIGMTMTALGNFCRDYLGATDGSNLDGGGSSTMVVNGTVMNTPSDGSERTVANGMMMINLAPKVQSATFTVGQTVITSGSASLRLGPGTNYAAFTTIAGGVQGTVVDHALKGVYAKGYYWWKVSFSGNVGWMAESLLGVPGAPVITQQPQPQNLCQGDVATFSVAATGAGTLTYQWQKNQANLINDGHYSGVTTTILTISNVTSSDVANYRCVVTNASGSSNSNEAALSLGGGVGSEFIVESRAGALNFTSYSEAGTWSDSTCKSGAAGVTGGVGSRWCTIGSGATAVFRFTPCINGTYEVFTTNCNTSNSGNPLIHKVAHAGGVASVGVCQNSTCGSNAINKWYSLGQYMLYAGVEYNVTLDSSTAAGSAPSGNAGRSDAIKWTCLSAAPTAPTITQQPQPQNVCPGGTAQFTVTATGEGTLTYQWQKNQGNLANGGHYSGVTTTTLTVSNADSGDAANYRCVVSNAGGDTNSNEAALTLVPGAPTAPTDGAPTADAADRITWRWTDVSDETGYRVKDAGGVSKSGDLAANATQWQESGLAPNTQYARNVCAFNGCGESSPSIGQSRYSLSVPPTEGSVAPSTPLPWLHEDVVWTAVGGFGAGTVQYYRYAWDQSPTHTWTESETQWSAETLVTNGSSAGTWYLHLKGYNAEGVANGTYDYLLIVASTVQADFDADSDVDLMDFATFQYCFGGPNVPPSKAGCETGDLDQDNDVDLMDFSVFQGCYNGPNQPPKC